MTDLKMLPLLEDARARIDAGWVQGNWYKGDPSGEVTHVCAKTALIMAANGGQMHQIGVSTLPWPSRLANQAEQFLLRILHRKRLRDAMVVPPTGCRCTACWSGAGFDSLPSFNDSMMTTKADVLALFDEGIVMLRVEQTALFEKKMREEQAMWAAIIADINASTYNYVIGEPKPTMTLTYTKASKWTLASTGAVVAAKIAGSVTEPANA